MSTYAQKRNANTTAPIRPLVLFLFLVIFFYATVIKTMPRAVQCIAISICYAVLSWESGRLLVIRVQAAIPGIRSWRKRFRLLLVTGLPLACTTAFIGHLGSLCTGFYPQMRIRDYSLLPDYIFYVAPL